MPLIEVVQSRQVSASIRLDHATAAQIDQYAAFIHASPDEVVDKALNYVFAKDREFQDFLRTPQASRVPAALRVRRAASGRSTESSQAERDAMPPPAARKV
jgi:hypothetical protein